MSDRLTISEFELNDDVLRVMEVIGNALLMDDPLKRSEVLNDFFSDSRPRIIDRTTKIRLLREKIQRIADRVR